MSVIFSISIWGWLDIFFTLMVLVGVCGELESIEKMLLPDSPHQIEPIEIRRKKIKKTAEIILIVGIAGELLCLFPTLVESSKLDHQARKADLRAFDTESNNVVLRSKIQDLEAKLRPRTIAQAQHDEFVKILERAQKHELWVLYNDNSLEVQSFAYQIRNLLSDAGFGVKQPQAVDAMLRQFGAGNFGNGIIHATETLLNNSKNAEVLVLISSKDISHVPVLAQSLLDAFNQVNIHADVVIDGMEGSRSMDSGEVAIFVPSKPGI